MTRRATFTHRKRGKHYSKKELEAREEAQRKLEEKALLVVEMQNEQGIMRATKSESQQHHDDASKTTEKNAANHRTAEGGERNETVIPPSNRFTNTKKRNAYNAPEQSKSLKRQAVSTTLLQGSQQIAQSQQVPSTNTANGIGAANSIEPSPTQTMNVVQQDPPTVTTTSSRPCASLALLSGRLRAHAVRIPPGQDLVPALQRAAEMAIAAGRWEAAADDDNVKSSSDSNKSDNGEKKNQKIATASSSSSSSSSAFVMTAVGSLSKVTLRMANADRSTANNDASSCSSSTTATMHNKEEEPLLVYNDRVEIVSLVGTFACMGSAKHLHMCVSKADGSCIGGHLISGQVFTTLELVLGTIDGVAFDREYDVKTGYRELVVRSYSTSE